MSAKSHFDDLKAYFPSAQDKEVNDIDPILDGIDNALKGLHAALAVKLEKLAVPQSMPEGDIAGQLEILVEHCRQNAALYEEISGLAGNSKKTVAPDIVDYVESNPKIVSLLRAAKSSKLSNDEIEELEKKINKSKTQILIVAAGLGSRLKGHTENLPKCMLDFGGKTLLERQLSVYRNCGIDNISLVRGYKKNKINYKNIKYLDNKDYEKNNILNSIFYGEKVINGNIIIAYSDILFESSVVQRLLDSDHDISVVVDIDWRGYYVGRKDHPIEEAENVIFNSNNEVVKIGKIATEKQEVHGEFIGMMKLSHRGAEIFKQNFHRVKKLFWNKPFQRSKTFQTAYLTDMIQELVDIGTKVHCVIIERGWKEIDTVEDYEKALKEFQQ